MRHRDTFHNKQNTQKMVTRSSGKPVNNTGHVSSSTPLRTFYYYPEFFKYCDIKYRDIKYCNIKYCDTYNNFRGSKEGD